MTNEDDEELPIDRPGYARMVAGCRLRLKISEEPSRVVRVPISND